MMQRHRTSWMRLVAVALAVTGILAVPTAALADDLDQTLDPNEAEGTGQVVLGHGHVDIGPHYVDGDWGLEVHDDSASPPVWRKLSDVVLQVNDQAEVAVPDDDNYSFLGQAPGSTVYVIPQTQNQQVVWAGWNTQDPNAMAAMSLGATFTVHGVHGPGDLVVYLQSGNFGAPEVLWDSRKTGDQDVWVDVNTHTHANWVFTAPGVYLVDFEVKAQLVSGETVTDREALRFAVGDGTSTDEALTAAFTGATGATGTTGTSSAPGAPVTTPTAGAAAAATGMPTSDPTGTLIAVVVGVVVLLLIVAVVVALLLGRRARRLADEQRRDGLPPGAGSRGGSVVNP